MRNPADMLRVGNRIAGSGIVEEDYSHNSGCKHYKPHMCKFKHETEVIEEPCVCRKMTPEEQERYGVK